MVATTVLALGSRRATVSFGALEIHTSSSTAIQSGLPGTGKTASGFSRSMGILTPGDLTPGLVAGGGVCRRAEPSNVAMTILIIIPTVHNNQDDSSKHTRSFPRLDPPGCAAAGGRDRRRGGTGRDAGGAVRGVFRIEGAAGAVRQLLRLPRRHADGRVAPRFARWAAQGRSTRAGGGSRGSRQEPADSGGPPDQ